jgi:hypothetical protein
MTLPFTLFPFPGASARVSSSARLKAARCGVPAGSYLELV